MEIKHHEWIEDVGVNISQYDDVNRVDVCKFCDCQKWSWFQVLPGKIKPQQYMLKKVKEGALQYWDPEEKCPDTYKLQKLSKPIQGTLF
jgi:hypothetical protein